MAMDRASIDTQAQPEREGESRLPYPQEFLLFIIFFVTMLISLVVMWAIGKVVRGLFRYIRPYLGELGEDRCI